MKSIAGLVWIPVSRLVFEQDAGSLDQSIVEKSQQFFAAEGEWNTDRVPPIVALFYTDGVHIMDGHHRAAAALLVGMKEVPVLNKAAMKRGDFGAQSRRIVKYRKLTKHPYWAIHNE